MNKKMEEPKTLVVPPKSMPSPKSNKTVSPFSDIPTEHIIVSSGHENTVFWRKLLYRRTFDSLTY